MEKEEILRRIYEIEMKIGRENSGVAEEIEKEAELKDIHNPFTDRYFYREARILPDRNIKKEKVYEDLIKSNNLEQFFSQSDFDIIYDVCKTNNRSSFYFTEEFCSLMRRYIIYLEYIQETNQEIPFSKFVNEQIYEKLLREEEYREWLEETEELQKNFVPKTNSELKQLYDKYQFFLDKVYREYVDELNCMDIIPFSEFLRMFDMADRNYRNVEAPIDHRLTTEIMNKYYQIFIENRNYQDKVSFREFWKMFNKCLSMDDKSKFKLNITNLVDEYVSNLDENLELDDLYGSKKRV